jgi:hypothetical protein
MPHHSVFLTLDLPPGPKPVQLLSCGYALYRVQPIWPAADSLPFCSWKRVLQLLSGSFAPLRRLCPSESTPPRVTSPGTFRPQGFTPSRRITPRPNARPYFMPVTPVGFFRLSRGFPPLLGSAGSSPANNPHGVLPRFPYVLHRNEARSCLAAPHCRVPKDTT